MGPLILSGAAAAAVGAAWAVRGRSSSVLAPSVWRGNPTRRAIALTFDDGPTPGTLPLLDILEQLGVRATFFMCGHNVEAREGIVRRVLGDGHEIGNHTQSHAQLWRLSPEAIQDEVRKCQLAIAGAAGVTPRWFRAPYGVRWFGLRAAQRECDLRGVMWTTIARDWTLDAKAVVARMMPRAAPGAIWCFHDGRVLNPDPDITNTLSAIATLLPRLRGEGWEFTTLSDLLGIQ